MSNRQSKDASISELFSTKGLDEMQLSKIYKVAYNCFRGLFWANLIITIFITIGNSEMQNPMVTIICLILALVTSIIYLVFVGTLAKTGALPSNFAQKGGFPVTISIVFYALIFNVVKLYFKEGNTFHLLECIPLLIFLISFVITYFLTRKNNKEVAKAESEEE